MINDIFDNKNKYLETEVHLNGWVRFNRVSNKIGFIDLFDGSNLEGIQLVYKIATPEIYKKLSSISLYSAIKVVGIVKESKKNILEIEVTKILDIYHSAEDHPLGKKEHTLEFLREKQELRAKTKLFQSIMHVRSSIILLTHEFFSKKGFNYLTTPIITSNDAEGAGETFNLSVGKGETFFSNQGSLTVSGQLHAESYAQAFTKVYTLGPTFRAEKSNTPRHSSEFWMLEPEIAFADYNDLMTIGIELLSYISSKLLLTSKEYIQHLADFSKKDLFETLSSLEKGKYKKISYKEAIKVLNEAISNGVKFENSKIEFGIDFSTEHEKYLAKQYAKGLIYIYDYPKSIKSFYMYQNDDNTCRGFDLLVPEIGELIGGSQREDRIDILEKIVETKGVDKKSLEWYIELRKFGYAPSSGFGLGIERLVMLLTGMDNIRDVIPFPITPGKLYY